MPRFVAIVGSRDYPDLRAVRQTVRQLGEHDPDIIIVSGGARGVDHVAEDEARRCYLATLVFLPQNQRYHPKRAPLERNSRLVDFLTVVRDAGQDVKVVAFWWQESGGTADVVRKAKGRGIPVEIRRGEPLPSLEDVAGKFDLTGGKSVQEHIERLWED